MEVHAHTHTPRKKFTHYLWEFLMLFLAVFCGFLAEYQLEHKIEKDRAKEFAEALYSDIASDTVYLEKIIDDTKEIVAFQDTLSDMLYKMGTENKKIHSARLYHFASLSRGGSIFSVKTSTLNQLKNSGSLRLFKNTDLTKLFADYDQAVSTEYLRLEDESRRRDDLDKAIWQIFEYSSIEKIEYLLTRYPLSRDSILNLEFPLISNDRRSISDLSYALANRRYNLVRRVEKFYSEPLEAGKKLIVALKKEYHLK
jgi:hypothetical protein